MDLGSRGNALSSKTKALISLAVTAKLICVFVFAYVKIRFSHDEAQLSMNKTKLSKTFSGEKVADQSGFLFFPNPKGEEE